MLPRVIPSDMPEHERAKWRAVRRDTFETLPGLILSANCDAGTCSMRVRGPDNIAEDGTRTATYKQVDHSLGADALVICGR